MTRRKRTDVPFGRCDRDVVHNGFCDKHQTQDTYQQFLRAVLREDWEERQAAIAEKLLPRAVEFKLTDQQWTRPPEPAPKPPPAPAPERKKAPLANDLRDLLPSREEAESALADLWKPLKR